MNGALDFLRAALPWIVFGLVLAVICAQGAHRKKEKEEPGNYATEGMCIGMCFGTAIGMSLGNQTGIGIALGVLIGLAVGTSIQKKSGDRNDGE